jgi:hypothetical protein
MVVKCIILRFKERTLITFDAITRICIVCGSLAIRQRRIEDVVSVTIKESKTSENALTLVYPDFVRQHLKKTLNDWASAKSSAVTQAAELAKYIRMVRLIFEIIRITSARQDNIYIRLMPH